MNMASTPVSSNASFNASSDWMTFNEYRSLWDRALKSELSGFRPTIIVTEFKWRDKMITFRQITEVESIRRKIEALQSVLSEHAAIVKFNWLATPAGGDAAKWINVDPQFVPALREVLCRSAVAKILILLDEAAKLGVLVENEKKILADFLQEISPKD